MHRPLIGPLITIAVTGFIASASTMPAVAASRPAFTIKDPMMRVQNGRLTYSLTICTPVKAILTLQGTFIPEPTGNGARAITPGSTQYQSKGCWPAFVSAPIARSAVACLPISCAAIKGHRYQGRVWITDGHPRQAHSRRARKPSPKACLATEALAADLGR